MGVDSVLGRVGRIGFVSRIGVVRIRWDLTQD
jgi:hypothetical protein